MQVLLINPSLIGSLFNDRMSLTPLQIIIPRGWSPTHALIFVIRNACILPLYRGKCNDLKEIARGRSCECSLGLALN